MSDQEIRVTEQQMAEYLQAIRERNNHLNPIETYKRLGDAAAAGLVGAAAGYFHIASKPYIPETISKYLAEIYLTGKHDAIKQAAAAAKDEQRAFYEKNGAVGPSYERNHYDYRDPVHVKKYELAGKWTPKVGNALVLIDALGSAAVWAIYQQNTDEADAVIFSMQQPAMHELASHWMEAEAFKASANKIISTVAQRKKGEGFNHDAVNQAFLQQIQANPKLADPLVGFWLECRELNFALDKTRLPDVQNKLDAIATHIERTGLADYRLPIFNDLAKSARHDFETQVHPRDALNH